MTNIEYRTLSIVFAGLFFVTFMALIVLGVSSESSSREEVETPSNEESYQTKNRSRDGESLEVELAGGGRISLEPNAYSIFSDSGDGFFRYLGEIDLEGPFHELEDLFFQTTDVNITALYNFGDYSREIAFVSALDEQIVHIDDNAFSESDQIMFGDASYSLSTNVPEGDCEELWDLPYEDTGWWQDIVDACNESGTVFVSQIFVNDDVAYSFSPIVLDRTPGGPEVPMGYAPSTWMRWVGVSPQLDLAYFEFIDDTFSLSSEGGIQRVDLPEDLVTIVFE